MTFRLDRFATLYVVSPFQRRAPKPTSSIPILMYHSISADAETGVRPYYRTSTSRQLFASQMKCLHENGYRTVSLAEVASQLQKPGFSDDKRIVITFDDGYNDFYCGAFPLLSRFGFSATVFLPTAFIGNTPLQFKGRDCLTWAEVRELSRHGVLFGSHTVTHPQLCKLDWGTIQTEIEKSKSTIEDETGFAVESFAYPYAFPQTERNFRHRLRELLRQAGYETGVCTMVGRAGRDSDPFFMERLPINSCDDTALFEAKLAGAYDWVRKSQYLVKTAKARLGKLREVKVTASFS